MKNTLRRHSIQFKLTLTFLFILLPLVGVSLFSNYYSQRMVYDQTTERTRGALLTTLEYVDQLTKNMDQQTLLIGSNPALVDVWRNIRDPLSRDLLFDIYTVQRQLSALTNVNGAVKEAFIVHGASGNGVSTLSGGIKWPNVQEESWFRQTIDAGGGLVVYVPTPANEGDSQYLNENDIYYARLLDVFGNNDEPNAMILVVDKSSLRKIVQHLQTSPNTDISLYYNGDFVLKSNPDFERSDEMISIKAESGSWSIAMEQPKAELFHQPRKLQKLTSWIIAVSALLAVWIASLVYVSIARPLHQMLRAINQFSGGNLNAQIGHRRKDEFGYLMNAFNRMADAQRKLIEDDYEKELRLARSEFSLLQSQINPHFLYNTLDSIYSVATKNRIGEISEMVINLAQFFRVSLGKGRESFTLEETVQHLMYYIRVQQIRTDHFAVDIELEEDTKQIPLLKLILQPIVENAIVHGLGKSLYGGDLSIRSWLEAGRLHLEVEDTGIGMEESVLGELREELEGITSKSYRISQEKPFSRFFGLKNVKARIKLYYGDEADLRVDSSYGEGTRVTMILPLRKEGKA
ncbi:sensor histidine kinase [Paenibacillus contaminans]|uniref:histidine kinase n=1 Tax=Paenibacillus contaminans TaxID=450362 RepID=A0A329MJI7_9BACL|nr:sensor histidine kinase [Paenibacillus contaminans]RAV20121.1 two-component sensor histidine kinase [Paenibacillus contaminans]